VGSLDEAATMYRLCLVEHRKRLSKAWEGASRTGDPDLVLAEDIASNHRSLEAFADCHSELTALLLSRGQRPEAVSLARESIRILEQALPKGEYARAKLYAELGRATGHLVLADVLHEHQPLQARQEYRLAREAYDKALGYADAMLQPLDDNTLRTIDDNSRRSGMSIRKDRITVLKGLIEDNIACLLATCPDAEIRDPKRAVEFATRAVQSTQKRPDRAWFCCSTLGVAHYRSGDWERATEALNRARAVKSQFLRSGGPIPTYLLVRKGGDSRDLFFLAMAQWQCGNKEQGRRWYDEAVVWMEQNWPKDAQLHRLRAEAGELLGVKDGARPADKDRQPK
jgi:tetratricopeptide (TPR) repeat protein